MADDSSVLVRLRLLGGALFNREAREAGTALRGVGASGRAADAGLRSTARGAKHAQGALERAKAAGAATFGVLRTIGTAGGAVAAYGLYQAGKATVQFDQSMRNVNSIAKLSETQFQRLSKSVIALGGETAQQPKTLADGLYDLVSSGFNAADSLKILRSSAKAATAGLTDTGTSTHAVAAVLNAYHLSARAAAKVSDTLFQVVNRGVITFPELATTIGDVLPFASSLGVGLNQVGAALSTMTKQGLSGSEATVRLKNTLVAFLKPSKDLATAIDKTGYSSGESLIKAKGFQGALEAVIKTTDGSKGAITAMFRNIRAAGGALALTGKNAKTAHGDLKGFANVRGVTDGVLHEQSKSLAYQWRKLKAEATGLGISLGHHVVPMAAKALGAISKLTSSKGAIGQFVTGVTSGAAPRVTHSRAEGGAGATRVTPAPAAQRVGATVTSTVGAAVKGAIALAKGALPVIGSVVKQVLDAIKPAMPFVKNVLLPLLKGIALGVLGGVVAAFKVAVPIIKVVASVLGFVGKAAAPLKGVFQGIGTVIGLVLGPWILKLLGELGKVGIVFRLLGAPIRLIGGMFTGLTRILGLLVRGFLRGFTFISRFVSTIGGSVGRVSRAALNLVGGVIHTVETLPGKVATLAGRAVTAIARKLGSGAAAVGKAAWNLGKSIIDGVVNFIKGAPGAIVSAVLSVLPGPIRSALKGVLNIGGNSPAPLSAITGKGARGRATGGTVQLGETTLVGERGPELARFRAGTQITPAGPTARAMNRRPAPVMAAAPVIHVTVQPNDLVLAGERVHRAVAKHEQFVVDSR